MKLFKYIFLFTFLTISLASAQQYNFQTTKLSILQKNKNREWGKWSKPTDTKIIVKLDLDKNKIIIYSSQIQHYSILEYLEKEVTDVDVINSYLCKSLDGIPVKISFMVRKDQNDKAQVYVYNKDFIFCYDIIELLK